VKFRLTDFFVFDLTRFLSPDLHEYRSLEKPKKAYYVKKTFLAF